VIPPPPPGGGGGGGGISPSSPQQACGARASSTILVGVQERIPIVRKTVNNKNDIFFIFADIKI
jgi:hypothetical protein